MLAPIGQVFAALAASQRVVDVRPLGSAGWLQLARSHWALRHRAKAMAALGRALAIKPDLSEANALRQRIDSTAE